MSNQIYLSELKLFPHCSIYFDIIFNDSTSQPKRKKHKTIKNALALNQNIVI